MNLLARYAVTAALVCAVVELLRWRLGAWPTALIVAPMLWGALMWLLAQLDHHPAPPPPARRTPPAPRRQLEPAQADALERSAALVELADAYMAWRARNVTPPRQNHRHGWPGT